MYSATCAVSEVGKFAEALSENAKVLVACTQEAPLFSELAEEQAFDGELRFANIRERAGWSTDKTANSAKIAALLADAAHSSEPSGSISIHIQRAVSGLRCRSAGT